MEKEPDGEPEAQLKMWIKGPQLQLRQTESNPLNDLLLGQFTITPHESGGQDGKSSISGLLWRYAAINAHNRTAPNIPHRNHKCTIELPHLTRSRTMLVAIGAGQLLFNCIGVTGDFQNAATYFFNIDRRPGVGIAHYKFLFAFNLSDRNAAV